MKFQFLLFLFIPVIIFSQGNPSFSDANIDDVYSQFNLTGDGVIFASIERGIDYTHPAFINPDGTTKIAYIYDMIDASGSNAPENTYGIGTIHTEADINASLLAGGTPLTTDRHGHGTACTGIVAGNGAGTTNKEFHGVAVNAKLIVVKMIHDAFPAFGDQPGQTGFFNSSYIPIALQFVADKTAELGLPSVTLMNFGSVGGPTDGTSLVSRAMDDFIANGNILVCGVGDDGGDDNNAFGTITQGQTQEILINKGVTGNLRFDMWYSEDDRFTVTIELPGGTQIGPFTAPAGPNNSADQNHTSFNMYHRGANVEFSQATSNKRELLIDFFGVTGVYKVIINGATISDTGNFNASLNPAAYYNNNRFLSHVVAGSSINDYTSAFNVITPGDYVTNNTWTDINGMARSRPVNEGSIGEIWSGSSAGPTYDGRQGIDFVAGGEVLFAPYSPNTYYSRFAFNMVQGGNNLYGLQTAVSAAAPVSCGVIALMLELDPTLTNQEVKDIITQTARQDSFTGTVPNNIWGSGKMDALASIQEVSNRLSVDTYNVSNLKIHPNPFNDVILIKSDDLIEKATVWSIEGKKIFSLDNGSKSINLSTLTRGVYFLQIETDTQSKTIKVLKK